MLQDQGYGTYKKTSLEAKAAAASPQEVMVLLSEGLLDEITRIEGHINAKRYDAKATSISKCMNILMGLESALNNNGNPDLLAKLRELYAFCNQRLYDASINNDATQLDAVREVMTNVRDGWLQLGAQQ